MRLQNVDIKNFRLLNNNSLRLDTNTTVLVGKNNSGKTSFSCIFEIFLNDKQFTFDDFSINCHQSFIDAFKEYLSVKTDDKKMEDFFINIDSKIPAIELIMDVMYDKNDNWNNIRPLLATLDDTNTVKIQFKYCIKEPKTFFENLHSDFTKSKLNKGNKNEKIIEIISKIHQQYFKKVVKPFSDDVKTEDMKISEINKIIGNYFIAAQRNVEDGASQTNSKLAPVFQSEYKRSEQKNEAMGIEESALHKLNNELDKANLNIDKKLSDFFKDFTESFATFGYPNVEGANIILKSNMTPTNVFTGIKLFYKDKEHLLPERYNGLGYSNLIYIISGILSFKSTLDEKPTDLNLIFIEEPEAHMHPQLQNTFILKLNEFLEKNKINAQIIITTHSSHIVSNAQFESIRYFCKSNGNISIKDLMEYKNSVQTASSSKVEVNSTDHNDEIAIDDDETDVDTIKFLKQYITLVKCDMFFADKIVLIEGLCERLLMPLFVEKVDEEIGSNPKYKGIRPLSEQYISVIEIGGAYMHKFKEFLEFLEVKTLIITDVDCCISKQSYSKEGSIIYLSDGKTSKTVKTAAEIQEENIDELFSTNPTLIKWMPKKRKISDLIFNKFDVKNNSTISVTFQKNCFANKKKIKCGRSFEEAFIIDNADYILQYKESLNSVKNKVKKYLNKDDLYRDSYSIYSYIDNNKKKSDFAFDLIYVHPEDWQVPTYIKEGLLWLVR